VTSERTDRLALEDILQSIDKILTYTSDGRDALFSDTRTQDAVVRNIEIIGEAVKILSDATRTAHPEVPWKLIARTRDRCIHHYFRVDLEIVWAIVETDLPVLRGQIAAMLAP
jgi:uncharacterized protein with HEPN domain